MLHEIWNVLLALAPWLLLGTALAAVMHVLLPDGFVHRQLQGRRGIFKAVALGVPLPLCSCGVIPAGLGLRRDGAGSGATVGFLISTPQTGVDSLLVSGAFLGWPFAVFKLASAAITGLVGGLIAHQIEPGEGAPPPAPVEGHSRRSWRAAVDHGLEILRSIWGWLVFGVILSAALTTWLPASALSGLMGYGVWATTAAVLALSLPLYVCATASVPIAAALVAAGLPPGMALVFLMAGPATNAATIGAIYRALGGRILAVYLITIVVGSVGLGLTFDQVLDAPGVSHVHEHSEASWWAVASVVALLGLIAWFAWETARGLLPQRASAQALVVGVDGLTCGGCVRKLEGKLRALPGVESVTVSREPGVASVSGKISEAQIHTTITEAGFRVAPAPA